MSSEKPPDSLPSPSPPLLGSSVKQQQQQQQQCITTSSSTSSITGERMVSSAGSMVLPGGVMNPSVPIRNIQMKFAVLVGLIEVGEVSNRDIVETVLNLRLQGLVLLEPVAQLQRAPPGQKLFCQPALHFSGQYNDPSSYAQFCSSYAARPACIRKQVERRRRGAGWGRRDRVVVRCCSGYVL
uniref:Uncharacterized protein n=1 Tax=Knipowitschia caucasica TaxID=637954 RepID=A0AAV2JCS3_KNICA